MLQQNRKFPALAVFPMLLLAASLASCTTGSTVTAKQSLCAPSRFITYSGTQDTPQTVRQIKVHNLTHQTIGCSA